MLITINTLIWTPRMRDEYRYNFHCCYFLLWNKSVQNVTPLKNMKLPIANAFQTIKSLFNPDGSIPSKHAHTPTAQNTLISPEERLFIIRIIIGMFQRGKTIEATRAILSIMILTFSTRFTRSKNIV